jgi:hypothetical protein
MVRDRLRDPIGNRCVGPPRIRGPRQEHQRRARPVALLCVRQCRSVPEDDGRDLPRHGGSVSTRWCSRPTVRSNERGQPTPGTGSLGPNYASTDHEVRMTSVGVRLRVPPPTRPASTFAGLDLASTFVSPSASMRPRRLAAVGASGRGAVAEADGVAIDALLIASREGSRVLMSCR